MRWRYLEHVMALDRLIMKEMEGIMKESVQILSLFTKEGFISHI